jgi:hypothetical protein
MANKPGAMNPDPFSTSYPARTPPPLGRCDAGDPDCVAEPGDTPAPAGHRGDGAAAVAHSWHVHAQGRTNRRNVHTQGQTRGGLAHPQDSILPRRSRSMPITLWGFTGIPRKLPATIEACPHKLVLPEKFVSDLHALYRHSEQMLWNQRTEKWSSDGKQVEWARRIVLYKSDEIKLAGEFETITLEGNVKVGELQIKKKVGNAWEPDTDCQTIGVAHTHPRTNTFSGGDIAALSNTIVDSRDIRIFAVIRKESIHLLLRTARTFVGIRDQEGWNKKAQAKADEAEKTLPSEFAWNKAIAQASTENDCALYVYERDHFRKIN